MAAEEDILLREVDDELKQDQTVAFFKKNGPWLGGLAALIVAGVAGLQIYGNVADRQAEANAEIFSAAVTASAEDQTAGAVTMLEAADEVEGGYAGLARLRAASFLAQDGDIAGAVSSLEAIAADGSLPNRMRDLARVRASHLVVDTNPAKARQLAQDVSTEAMQPLADEALALADLAAGDYAAAYDGFARLAELDPTTTYPTVIQRAQLMAPIADAARRGVPLEAQVSESEAFIQSFSDRLGEELNAPEDDTSVPEEGTGAEEDSTAEDDNN